MLASSPSTLPLLDQVQRIVGNRQGILDRFRPTPTCALAYYEDKMRICAALNPLELALFNYCLQKEGKEFALKIILPLAQVNAAEDAMSEAFSTLPSNLRNANVVLVCYVAHILQQQKLFDDLCLCLEPGAVTVLRYLSIEARSAPVDEMEKLTGETIVSYKKQEQYFRPTHNMHYALFVYEGTIYDTKLRTSRFRLCLPSAVRTCIRQRFLQEAASSLPSIDALPNDTASFRYNAETVILQNASILWSYITLDKVENKPGKKRKPTKPSLREMKTMCGFQEFFPADAKEMDTLTAETFVEFLRAVPQAIDTTSPLELLQAWFEAYRKGKYRIKEMLLGHLHDLNDRRSLKAHQEEIITLLKLFPSQKWVPIESLELYGKNHSDELDIATNENSHDFYILQLPEQNPNSRYYMSRSINPAQYNDVVITPMLKGMMFFFAAFGIVEIAYDMPLNTLLQQGSKPYLSVYDGLKAVRITPLGEFILGRKADYTPSDEITPRVSHKVNFDEQRLIASIHPDDKVRQMVVSRYMKPLALAAGTTSPTGVESVPRLYYKMNYDVFLAGCSKKREIEDKIRDFRAQMLANDQVLPERWEGFFTDVVAKAAPLQKLPNLVVFALTPSPELTTILTQDEVLRSIIHKVEGFRIAIAQKDIETLYKRLRGHGYLMQEIEKTSKK
ncbi:MAG: hypothetical protein ACOVSW_23065 [Candidatus Kapaibacteriota bacterium]